MHSVCSYFAMFPPQLPNVFINWLTESGDAVYDPFSGRGTVPLEAVLAGRVGYGSDANPLAVALSSAKVEVPARQTVMRRLAELEAAYVPGYTGEAPDSIRMLYSTKTLRQLLYLRQALRPQRRDDALLRAATLGLLHGNHSRAGATRSLSISMPNTFAMSPGYVAAYIKKHNLERPKVDVFAMLRRRLEQLELPSRSIAGGRVWLQDVAREPPRWLQQDKVQLVFTSPPYLQVIKYGKYNWIRLWFLGAEPKDVDNRLTDTASLDRYRDFISGALRNLRSVVAEDGFVCLVIGDVRRRDGRNLNLAKDVWDEVAEPDGWKLHGLVTDRLPTGHKVSRIWKQSPGQATKTDRVLIMSPSKGAPELPPLGRISWNDRAAWPEPNAGRGGT